MMSMKQVARKAGHEDGAAGKRPIGDTDSYLAGHGEGIEEFIKHHAEVRANLSETRPTKEDFAQAEREIRKMVREGWAYDSQKGWVSPTGKLMCPGKDFYERQDTRGPLFACTRCGRVNRTTRSHQMPGRTTASHDKTMGTLWDMAGTTIRFWST